MDAMKFSKFPRNKTLKFPRAASDNNILHNIAGKHEYIQISNNSNFCFAHPGGKQIGCAEGKFTSYGCIENNKGCSDLNKSGENRKVSSKSLRNSIVESLRKNSVSCIDNDDKANFKVNRSIMNNAFEIERNDGLKTAEFHIGDNETDKKNTNSFSITIHQKKALVPKRIDFENENNLSDIMDEELEKLPDLDNSTKSGHRIKSNAVNSNLTPASSDGDYNNLSDVEDEELRHLPDLEIPSGIISRIMNKNIVKYNGIRNDSPKMVTNKVKRIHQLKRSISSIESDEEITSFFGSIRNRNARKDNDDIDGEASNELFYFSAYTSVTSGHPRSLRYDHELTLNRAYSAESFMKRRESDKVRNSIYSQISSRKNSSLIETNDDKDAIGRLHMRRGALAQPEKMLISQELRERTQRGVEKRKTFMRKVSQFFNLHLRLNLEEDLI